MMKCDMLSPVRLPPGSPVSDGPKPTASMEVRWGEDQESTDARDAQESESSDTAQELRGFDSYFSEPFEDQNWNSYDQRLVEFDAWFERQ